MVHELKTWSAAFFAVKSGRKRHDIRRHDRPFGVGDLLVLKEYDPNTGRYTGREHTVCVTYLTRGGEWGLPEDLCVMSIVPIVPYTLEPR